ncbi:acylneuraminate cytidylyltransferase family protein [Patescibacteria group bacterium]|nr:acylneuraminate cytidylyltransferase family protein [Patescibacteria group bacterium]
MRPFAGIDGGLARIKLEQLSKMKMVDEIILSTNDKDIIDIGQRLDIPQLKIDRRPEHLCTNETTTDDLIKYVPSLTQNEHILWTHVTSPFIQAKSYEAAIRIYFNNSTSEFDSLMSVTKLQTFIWDQNGPINYDREQQKWPFTQSLPPLYEVNSGIFISSRNNYIALNDRIGKKPYLYILDGKESFDIDWEEDFAIAEKMYN